MIFFVLQFQLAVISSTNCFLSYPSILHLSHIHCMPAVFRLRYLKQLKLIIIWHLDIINSTGLHTDHLLIDELAAKRFWMFWRSALTQRLRSYMKRCIRDREVSPMCSKSWVKVLSIYISHKIMFALSRGLTETTSFL